MLQVVNESCQETALVHLRRRSPLAGLGSGGGELESHSKGGEKLSHANGGGLKKEGRNQRRKRITEGGGNREDILSRSKVVEIRPGFVEENGKWNVRLQGANEKTSPEHNQRITNQKKSRGTRNRPGKNDRRGCGHRPAAQDDSACHRRRGGDRRRSGHLLYVD